MTRTPLQGAEQGWEAVLQKQAMLTSAAKSDGQEATTAARMAASSRGEAAAA
jgi:hypothetical protein